MMMIIVMSTKNKVFRSRFGFQAQIQTQHVLQINDLDQLRPFLGQEKADSCG